MTPSDRRKATRAKLVELAETQISAAGLEGLRARDLARDAGISLGGIYTHFKDLDALVLEVNARSFRAIGEAVSAAARGASDPTERLIAMAKAYHRFARDHTARWQALFENNIVTRDNVPDWYRAEVGELFAMIGAQVAAINPALPPEKVTLLARGLFGAAHGIISLSIQSRLSAVAPQEVPEILEMMIRAATRVT